MLDWNWKGNQGLITYVQQVLDHICVVVGEQTVNRGVVNVACPQWMAPREVSQG